MPRDLYLVAPEPVTMTALIAAAAQIDDSLVLRALFKGSALQLLDAGDVAVLTIENSRRLDAQSDLARLLPDADIPSGEVWWMDATAPWGERGTLGVLVFEKLAAVLGGSALVRDGS